MIPRNVTFKTVSFTAVIALLLFSAFAYAESRPEYKAQGTTAATPMPPLADADTLAPTPSYLAGRQAQVNPAAVSSTLSYYFISGNTFTPDIGASAYFRQATGCVNQMPLNYFFSAPVHLPQASQVVSITLYTYDSAITTTVSTAYFILNDGKGGGGYTVSASSLANTADYQQNTSTQNNPTTVDNQNYNYYVQWQTSGSNPSPILSLCGVRVAYYAPLGATYLPYITKQ